MPRRSETRVRVRSYELDSYGHVNNAVYAQWLEHGRSRLLQDEGFTYNNIEDHWGVRFVLVSSKIDYRAGLSLDDEVLLTCEVERMGRTSVTFKQLIQRIDPKGGSLTLAAEAQTIITFTDPKMSSTVPIPEPFKALYG